MTGSSSTRFSAALPPAPDEDRCARCELLPRLVRGRSRLVLDVPIRYTMHKLRRILSQQTWPHREREGLFEITVDESALQGLARVLKDAFTVVEQDEIRAVLLPFDSEPTVRDYLAADSLRAILVRSRASALIDVLAEERITTAFQPIVEAQSLRLHGFEALLRVDDDAFAGPAEFFHTARLAHLLPHADLAARRGSISAAARHAIDVNVFINFAPAAIYDPNSCLRTTMQLLDELLLPHDRIVFEVIESEEIADGRHLRNVLSVYRENGFKVALDDLGAGFASLNLLHTLRPDYVKLDLELIRDVDSDGYKATIAAKLIEAARALGMQVVAEGVETEGELQWLRDNGATLVQGFLIGRPAAVPSAVLAR